MLERDKYIIWDANEVIYRAGDPSEEAFLIMDGSVELFTAEGLRLNRIGANEILGETSLLIEIGTDSDGDRICCRREGDPHPASAFQRNLQP